MKFEIDVKKLLEKGAYFGHKISRTTPKALDYTYKAQNGIYLIDLFKTKECVEKAMLELFEAGKLNRKLLIVGTKRIIKTVVKEMAEKEDIFYLSNKWVGGFFTNFDEIYKNLKETNKMIDERKRGDWNSLPKHEISKKEKRLNKFLKVYEGVLKMEEVPENILIIDTKKEKNALKESLTIKTTNSNKETNLTIYGLIDTNSDPNLLDHPMMLNDDSTLTLEYVLEHLIKSYSAGLKKYKPKTENGEPKKS